MVYVEINQFTVKLYSNFTKYIADVKFHDIHAWKDKMPFFTTH